jgi:hypothetical protein
LFQLFADSIVDTGGKFSTGVNSTSGTGGIFKRFAKDKTHFLPINQINLLLISILKFQRSKKKYTTERYRKKEPIKQE